MKWFPLLCLSVGCTLAVYLALRAPVPGVLVAAVAAVGLLTAGGIARRYRLLVWSADTVVVEYCLGLILADKRPGVVESVVLGLGILAF